MEHDQLFKVLLREFLKEFLELFFPDLLPKLKLSTVTWQRQEQVLTLETGEHQKIDLLAEVETVDGDSELILIHIEVERKHLTVFRERMWRYYSWLTVHRRQDVFPIAVYLTAGSGGLVREEYERKLFGRRHLLFEFEAVGLPDLKGETYQNSTNPLAYALSALMRRPPGIERVAWKYHCLQGILKYEQNKARQAALTICVNKYINLTAKEERKFKAMVPEETQVTLETLVNQYWETEGERKGIIKGERQGLLHLLSLRFADTPIPQTLLRHFQALNDSQEIKQWYERVLHANRPDELLVA